MDSCAPRRVGFALRMMLRGRPGASISSQLQLRLALGFGSCNIPCRVARLARNKCLVQSTCCCALLPLQAPSSSMEVEKRESHPATSGAVGSAQQPAAECSGGLSGWEVRFRVTDYTPDWDFTTGGAKVIITGGWWRMTDLQLGGAAVLQTS